MAGASKNAGNEDTSSTSSHCIWPLSTAKVRAGTEERVCAGPAAIELVTSPKCLQPVACVVVAILKINGQHLFTFHLTYYSSFNLILSPNMPTIGTKPSLRSTQAVGAVLLHQFARERFVRAGIDENLIKEAENREHLDDLAAVLLQDDDNTPNDYESESANNTTILTNTTATTNGADNGNATMTDTGEQYHSMAADSFVNGNDRTMYHSMTAANQSATNSSTSTLDQLQSSPNLASYGQELRRIAEEFEKTRLRQSVKDRAEQVKLSDIKRENFFELLEELFQDKITREKIVILFFFCTDVALRAATLAQELVIKLMGWSFSYIINTVCSLVYKLGGWDKVLFYQLPSILISCCAALAICSLVVYLKKSLKG